MKRMLLLHWKSCLPPPQKVDSVAFYALFLDKISQGAAPGVEGLDSMGYVICLLDRLTHIYLANYQYSVYCLFYIF